MVNFPGIAKKFRWKKPCSTWLNIDNPKFGPMFFRWASFLLEALLVLYTCAVSTILAFDCNCRVCYEGPFGLYNTTLPQCA